MAAEGDDVLFRLRTRSAAVALDNPALRVQGAFSHIVPESELRLAMSRVGRSYCLDVNGRVTCGLGFTLGVGWALFGYTQVPVGWPQRVLNLVWMATLLFPFGFWLRYRWESLLGAAILIIAAVLVCVVGHLRGAPLEIGAALAGTSAGWIGGRAISLRLARRDRRSHDDQ
jgi:hypothetical protein